MKQFQNPKEKPRSNDKGARFAFRCTKEDKAKLLRSGGAAWLRELIRNA